MKVIFNGYLSDKLSNKPGMCERGTKVFGRAMRKHQRKSISKAETGPRGADKDLVFLPDSVLLEAGIVQEPADVLEYFVLLDKVHA